MGAPGTYGDTFEPAIAGFFCEQCGEDCLGKSGESHGGFPPNLKSTRLICAEKISPDIIRQAFEYGADGVLICGCLVGKCRSAGNNREVLTQIHQGKAVLKELGLTQSRLRQEWICGPDVDSVRDIVRDFTEQLRALGTLKPQDSDPVQNSI